MVDDHDGVRRSLRRALSQRGYDVVLAHDRPSALYAAKQREMDWAIIDQRLSRALGDRSGLDLAEELLEAHPRLRVVILTGYATTDAAFRAARRDRIVDYIEKPASLDTICATFEGRTATAPKPMALERVIESHISRVLADHDGNITRAAAALGITRGALRRKLR